MFVDEVTGLLCNVGKEVRQVVTFKEFDLATFCTKQNVLMAVDGAQVTMATIRQVDALDQPEFLKFFESAINGDQTYTGMITAGNVVQFQRAEGAATAGNNFDQGLARGSEAISVILKQVKPIFGQ
jgi:hypothetical protein